MYSDISIYIYFTFFIRYFFLILFILIKFFFSELRLAFDLQFNYQFKIEIVCGPRLTHPYARPLFQLAFRSSFDMCFCVCVCECVFVCVCAFFVKAAKFVSAVFVNFVYIR